MSSCFLFIKRGLQFSMVCCGCGGFSSLRAVERGQCWVTCIVAGSKFESDHFGSSPHTDGQPRSDATLERRNLDYTAQRCAKVLSSDGAFAYGRPILSIVPPDSKHCNSACSVPEESIRARQNAKGPGSGSCGCGFLTTGTRCAGENCRSCGVWIYRVHFGVNAGRCDNPAPVPFPEGFKNLSAADVETLPFEDLANLLTGRDIEFFSIEHMLSLHHCVQVKLCVNSHCWYCSRFTEDMRIEDLDWYPYYSTPSSMGNWILLPERRKLMRDPATRNWAFRHFLSDNALPSRIVKKAWEESSILSMGDHTREAFDRSVVCVTNLLSVLRDIRMQRCWLNALS
eukprot:Lithocolla_globosa_v1_NODE_861_length_3171_cov_38.506739.p1 type:complete len:341 gc:universal NODE_861_length_3171_cov_38.506739:1233-2255(+)